MTQLFICNNLEDLEFIECQCQVCRIFSEIIEWEELYYYTLNKKALLKKIENREQPLNPKQEYFAIQKLLSERRKCKIAFLKHLLDLNCVDKEDNLLLFENNFVTYRELKIVLACIVYQYVNDFIILGDFNILFYCLIIENNFKQFQTDNYHDMCDDFSSLNPLDYLNKYSHPFWKLVFMGPEVYESSVRMYTLDEFKISIQYERISGDDTDKMAEARKVTPQSYFGRTRNNDLYPP